jgi:hypothetical protein
MARQGIKPSTGRVLLMDSGEIVLYFVALLLIYLGFLGLRGE